MDVRQTQQGSITVVAVSGRVDHGNAEVLRSAIKTALSNPHTVLDFAALDHISSAGLRVLVLAAREAKAKGAYLSICALQPVVREIFAISRFDQVFDIHADRASALQAAGADA